MTPNTTIGHYRIIRPLGKGGMGEVYLAEDTRLQRQVALKILPESLRQNPERLARFRREALAAAKLKHPNIAVIYALEEADGQTFITMEYVEGKTLSERIPSDGMDLDAFFNTFIPLADALAHAHENGRIHRDLKPGNIMVTAEGVPKILDFGLARIITPDPVQAAYEQTVTTPEIDSEAPTVTMKPEDHQGVTSLTRGGQLMGTPQYMSPEQAERKETDARTDIFSFGVVMYEALTGQKLFDGDTLESIIGRILEAEPKAVTEIKPVTPHQLWWTIRNCLQKDREHRLQTSRELHVNLQAVQQEVQAGTDLVDRRAMPKPEPVPLWRQPIAIVAMVLTLIIGGSAIWFLKPMPQVAEPPLRKFQWEIEGLKDQVISPDGSMIAYTTEAGLWIRDLDQTVSRQIPDSEGASKPFWSPQSDYVAYNARGGFRKVSAQGGLSTTLGAAVGAATWRRDGTILISQAWGLFMVSAQGGEPVPFLRPDSVQGERRFSTSSPVSLPDDQTLIFVAVNRDGSRALVVQNGETRRSIVHSNPGEYLGFPAYAQSGHILYMQGGHIRAIPFSLDTLTPTGDPFPVVQDGRFPSVSEDGTLVYQAFKGNPEQQLVWVDRNGTVEGTIGLPQEQIMMPALSPDGRRVAIGASVQNNMDIWIHDFDLGTTNKLTVNPEIDFEPTWSPDSRQILYTSQRGQGEFDLFLADADGIGTSHPLKADPIWASNPHWSPDGRYLVYHVNDPETKRDLWYLPMHGDRTPQPLWQTRFEEGAPRLSPDGRYVAYQSDETGREEVWVITFPDGDRRWPVSTGGGVHPRWNPQGNELFYVSDDAREDARLMVVKIQTEPTFQPLGSPQVLFSEDQVPTRLIPTDLGYTTFAPVYDVSSDGQRFVVVQRLQERGTMPTITVVENWIREFEGRE